MARRYRKRHPDRPGEEAQAISQLDHLPHWLGDIITGVLDSYARQRGFELIAWYHDLPIWLLEAERQRIQVSACADQNDLPVLVVTGDTGENSLVVSLPEDRVAVLPLSLAEEKLPGILDRIAARR